MTPPHTINHAQFGGVLAVGVGGIVAMAALVHLRRARERVTALYTEALLTVPRHVLASAGFAEVGPSGTRRRRWRLAARRRVRGFPVIAELATAVASLRRLLRLRGGAR